MLARTNYDTRGASLSEYAGRLCRPDL